MPVTQRKTAAMKRTLLAKGFAEGKTKHHDMYWFIANGKKTTIHTNFSHGAKRYDRQLLSCVKRDIRLDDWDEFDRFMDCPMREPEYLQLMIARGHVKP